jgi:hypothetical protein
MHVCMHVTQSSRKLFRARARVVLGAGKTYYTKRSESISQTHSSIVSSECCTARITHTHSTLLHTRTHTHTHTHTHIHTHMHIHEYTHIVYREYSISRVMQPTPSIHTYTFIYTRYTHRCAHTTYREYSISRVMQATQLKNVPQ